jgi:DNA-binding MarR family transcriptional regulator
MPKTSPSTLYQLIWQTRRLFQRLRATSEELLVGRGINTGQRAMLEFLHQKQPQTVPQIAREKSVSRQHVQTVANGLLVLKLIESVENPDHKRSPLLKLATKGTILFESIQKDEAVFIKLMEKNFSQKELTTTLNTLKSFDDYLASVDWKRDKKP